jgi:hypothetical protein
VWPQLDHCASLKVGLRKLTQDELLARLAQFTLRSLANVRQNNTSYRCKTAQGSRVTLAQVACKRSQAISVTIAAFEAIRATFSAVSRDRCAASLRGHVLAGRGAGESYSDVILRLAKVTS